MVFVEFEALEGGRTGYQFVGELCLVFVAAIAIDLLVGVIRLACREQ